MTLPEINGKLTNELCDAILQLPPTDETHDILGNALPMWEGNTLGDALEYISDFTTDDECIHIWPSLTSSGKWSCMVVIRVGLTKKKTGIPTCYDAYNYAIQQLALMMSKTRTL